MTKNTSSRPEEKGYIHERLSKIDNLRHFRPTVNFVLIKFASESTALKVIDELKDQKILVRSCANFRGLDSGYIRLAIRSREENCKVIDSIIRILS